MFQPLAIQSWCYRNFKQLGQFLDLLKQSGVNATEVSGAHANFADAATWPAMIEQCRKAGVQLVAIGVQRLSGNLDQDRSNFEFCKAAGIKNMSITFAPEAMWDGLRNIEKLADQYDMKLGIHNHGGYDWLGNSVILKYIFGKTSSRIGLHMDTAWAFDAKQDPIAMAEQFRDRMFGIHIKDFIYDRAKQFQDVVIGTGNLDLPRLVQTLKQINFTGPLVIEYEGDVENPVPALKQCVEAMRKLL